MVSETATNLQETEPSASSKTSSDQEPPQADPNQFSTNNNDSVKSYTKENIWYYPIRANRVNTILETYKPPSKFDRVPAMSKGSRRIMGYNLTAILPERRHFEMSKKKLLNNKQVLLKKHQRLLGKHSGSSENYYDDDDDDDDDEYVMVYDSSKIVNVPSSSSSSTTTNNNQIKSSQNSASNTNSPASAVSMRTDENHSNSIATTVTNKLVKFKFSYICIYIRIKVEDLYVH